MKHRFYTMLATFFITASLALMAQSSFAQTSILKKVIQLQQHKITGIFPEVL